MNLKRKMYNMKYHNDLKLVSIYREYLPQFLLYNKRFQNEYQEYF